MKKLLSTLAVIAIMALSAPIADAAVCSAGEPGSLSCSVSVTIMGQSATWSVSCTSGYYACCNSYRGSAVCIKSGKSTDTPNPIN